LARRAVSLLHQGEGRTNEDLEGDKLPPAPDQDIGSNWIFQELWSCRESNLDAAVSRRDKRI